MKKFLKYYLLVLFSIFAIQNSVGQQKSMLILNGTLHIGNGEKIDKCAVGIENGVIKEVYNSNIVDPGLLKYDTVINVEGMHIYPAFIAPNTNLGLIEIGAVRASQDDDEVGEMNPNVRSLIAYNAESKITPTLRTNGVLMAQITPNGGFISGSSSVVGLDAWNWEDAVIREDDGIHVNWPGLVKGNSEKAKELEKKRTEKLESLNTFFLNADAYRKGTFHYEKNLKFESMKGLFEGSKTLYIHADHVKEISEAIYFTRNFKISKIVLVGGFDAWRIPELLKDNHISVIVRRVHSLPPREDEDVDLPYKLPSLLEQAGILYCLDVSGAMGPMQGRNLPFYAGTAMSYGLTEEQAVRSISLNSAKILGIDKKYGSIEKGKSATLFISKGNALDMKSNDVILALIDGKIIKLNNHQKELYLKYSKKLQHSEIKE